MEKVCCLGNMSELFPQLAFKQQVFNLIIKWNSLINRQPIRHLIYLKFTHLTGLPFRYILCFCLKAMRSEGRDIDIGVMMDRWTLQMGYPVVTISKNQSEQLTTHYIMVTQEHFLYGEEVRNNIRLDSFKATNSTRQTVYWGYRGSLDLSVYL